jgi:hypothetical protein
LMARTQVQRPLIVLMGTVLPAIPGNPDPRPGNGGQPDTGQGDHQPIGLKAHETLQGIRVPAT